mmetsp:Transcript_28699/g.60244  ORF Transcript_28699/g.60244 Transcript_28699/m.60244 type:complete len:100 (-) Transcript_28699:504-803(-)
MDDRKKMSALVSLVITVFALWALLSPSSASSFLERAPECRSADQELGSRWEYTTCICRYRFWNCGDGKAKHIRMCMGSNGDRYNLAYETCQVVPIGTPA